jgi:glycerophosphoryl diester phosphodiesterase
MSSDMTGGEIKRGKQAAPLGPSTKLGVNWTELRHQLEETVMSAADFSVSLLPDSLLPQKLELDPGRDRPLLIAHRGAWLEAGFLENTLPAFQRAIDCGCDGLEFDVHLPLDGVPVVHHDTNTARVFGRDCDLGSTQFADMRRQFPQIPTLQEVATKFPSAHLFVEIKGTAESWSAAERARVREALGEHANWHVMSLDLKTLTLFAQDASFGSRRCVPVATTNVAEASGLALEQNWAALTGQWLLLSSGRISLHRARGQMLGAGFIASRNSLVREWRRGVGWIFTNHGHLVAGWWQQISKSRDGIDTSQTGTP